MADGGELGRLPARRARARHARARRRLRPGHDHRRLRRRVAPAPVLGLDRADEVLDGTRAAARTRASTTSSSPSGDVYDARLARRRRSTSCTRTRCCSTSPTRSRRCARCVGCAGPAASSRRGTPTTPRSRGGPRTRALTGGSSCTTTSPAATDAEPDAGRRLLAWARGAGFADIVATASVWCFATPEDRAWWGGLWSDRVVASAFADQAIDGGLATRAELEHISVGVARRGASHPTPGSRSCTGSSAPRRRWRELIDGDRGAVVAVDGGERLHRVAPQLRRPLARRVPEREDAGDDDVIGDREQLTRSAGSSRMATVVITPPSPASWAASSRLHANG